MDTLFFWLSKLVWFFLSPLNFILLLLITTWLLFLTDTKRFIKPLMSGIMLVLLFIALFPVGDWLLYPLETRFKTNPVLPKSIEGIVVLSGALHPERSALWQQTEVSGAVDRELAFMRLARTYPEAALIYTGGSSKLINNELKAADIAERLFEEQGMDTKRILFERQARNTYENATLSLELAKPKLEKTWILITSAFHMPRSIGIFCKAGWPMLPYPVDHQTRPGQLFKINFNLAGHLLALDLAIHEWIGLIAYRVSGKTQAILPAQCDS